MLFVVSQSAEAQRLSWEHRDGIDTDVKVPRGAASITKSPLYDEALRLSAWATGSGNDYEYGMATAMYFFKIPSNARFVKIVISYKGDSERNWGDAGRVWVRREKQAGEYEKYYPEEGRYEKEDAPLYGSTFYLQAGKYLEVIRISAFPYYVVDGTLELHIVAEGTQLIDIRYITVESFDASLPVKTVKKVYRTYDWRPWYDYTYWYFYVGPEYYSTRYYYGPDGYYYYEYRRYDYPGYGYRYTEIRKKYGTYIYEYRRSYPQRCFSWTSVYSFRSSWPTYRLTYWTPRHNEVREYYRTQYVDCPGNPSRERIRKARERIRSVLASQGRKSRSEAALSDFRKPEQDAEPGVPSRPFSNQKRRVETSRGGAANSPSRVSSSKLSGAPSRFSNREEALKHFKTRRESSRVAGQGALSQERSSSALQRTNASQTKQRSASQPIITQADRGVKLAPKDTRSSSVKSRREVTREASNRIVMPQRSGSSVRQAPQEKTRPRAENPGHRSSRSSRTGSSEIRRAPQRTTSSSSESSNGEEENQKRRMSRRSR